MSEIKPGDEYITLELSMDEAQVVKTVLDSIQWFPENEGMGKAGLCANHVYVALEKAGISQDDSLIKEDSRCIGGQHLV